MSVLLPDIVEVANVRMVQRRDGARLTFEPLSRFRVLGQVRRQNFYRDRPIQAGIAGTIHLTRATRTKRRLDFIGPELCPVSESHRARNYRLCRSLQADA